MRAMILTLAATTCMAADVTSFTLINADTNQPISGYSPFSSGATFNLATLPSQKLNIRADTTGSVGSVVFAWSGAESGSLTESVAPYAMKGDTSGVYKAWTPTVGSYSLTGTPYAGSGGSGGTAGAALTVAFTVSNAGTPPPPPPPTGNQNDGDGSVTIGGELRQWHKVTLTMNGPWADEAGAWNPATDYRMDVTFSQAGLSYTVPGYFAADGNASETSATTGTSWRAHVSPDVTGTWAYSVSFYKSGTSGSAIAVNGGGSALAPYHGKTGTFNVSATNKTGTDFRGKGRLEVVSGSRYLRHKGTGEWFIKAGPDSPENLLGYTDIDGTYKQGGGAIKSWSPHTGDWNSGDPTWKGTKGKGLVGALNYLSSEGLNVFSFLTYNAGGDGKDVWPFTAHDQRLRYDCSKLDQWDILFSHADKLGLYLHFKTQETENNNGSWGLDGGNVGVERKLYYRQLIARFSHHLALNWNLGEENTQTEAQRKAMAQYFYDNDPYHHNVVLHTYPGQQESVYRPLLGSASKLTGVSIQIGEGSVHKETLQWIQESAAAGQVWIVANDEQGSADVGIPPDPSYGGYSGGITQNQVRDHVLWGNLMAGGAGIECYFGYQTGETDLTLQDFRSRDRWWDYCRHALTFFNSELPYNNMANANALIGNGSNNNGKYCLAQLGEVYAVYLGSGGPTTLNLSGQSGAFTVRWFDPRNGGALQVGSVSTVNGGGSPSLGNPPNATSQDWVALVRRSGVNPPVNVAPTANAGADQTKSDSDNNGSESVALNGSASSDSDGSIASWTWREGSTVIANGATPSVTFAVGTHTVVVTVTDNNGATATDTVVIIIQAGTTTQTSFKGTPHAVPGRIQAEDYDLGGAGVAFFDASSGNSGGQYRSDAVDIQTTSDTGGGNNVGWISAGEWLEYTVSVAQTGTYDVQFRVASASSGGAVHLEVDGSNVSGTVTFAATGGWQNWTTVTATGVPLTAGQQVLRLSMDASNFNVNWFEVIAGSTPPPPPAPVSLAVNSGGGTYTAVDGTVYAADTGFNGGSTYSSSAGIAGTEDDAIYRSERYAQNVGYAFTIPNGDYLLVLEVAEVYFTATGQRVFDITVEGTLVVDNLDIIAAAGGKDVAYDIDVPVQITDGQLNIELNASVNNAKLAGIRLEPMPTAAQ